MRQDQHEKIKVIHSYMPKHTWHVRPSPFGPFLNEDITILLLERAQSDHQLGHRSLPLKSDNPALEKL